MPYVSLALEAELRGGLIILPVSLKSVTWEPFLVCVCDFQLHLGGVRRPQNAQEWIRKVNCTLQVSPLKVHKIAL